MINRDDPLPITKQCHILELSRSSVYYIPAQLPDKDRELMRLIDEIHLEEPYLGSRGMKSTLRIRGCHRRWYKYPDWRNKMSSIFIINLVYPQDVNPGGVADDQKGGLDGYQNKG